MSRYLGVFLLALSANAVADPTPPAAPPAASATAAAAPAPPPVLMQYSKADARTRALVDRVAAAFGGVARLSSLRSVYDVVKTTEKTPRGIRESRLAGLYVYPDRAWARMDANGSATLVVTPHQSWIKGKNIPNDAAMKMPPDLKKELLRRLDLDPVFVLAHRELSSLRFAAGQTKTEGDRTVEILHVRSNDTDSTWTIDAKDGRLVANTIGELTMQYSDWRTVKGITVPYRIEVTDRKGNRRSMVVQACDFDLAFDEHALFDTPRIWFDPELDLSKTFDRYQYLKAIYDYYYYSYYYYDYYYYRP